MLTQRKCWRVQTPNKKPKYRPDWDHSIGIEIGRLVQGMPGHVNGTNTIRFVYKHEFPHLTDGKTGTYSRVVCNQRPQKEEVNHTRITVGGNLINFPGDCGTPTADTLLVKLLLNSVISTPGAKFVTVAVDINSSTSTPQ